MSTTNRFEIGTKKYAHRLRDWGRYGTGSVLFLVLLLAGFSSPVFAAGLSRVGPVDAANGGYPAWYQDKTGLTIEFCNPTNQAELNDGWCLILPADVPSGGAPETPFTNYSEEHFYWSGGAVSPDGNAILTLALEGAFANGPAIAGDQVVFGRLRIVIKDLSLYGAGDYKIHTPYGVLDFPGLSGAGKLFFTSDIGITCGAQFDCALNSQIGPFLLPSATPGGAEMPPLTAANPTPDTDPAHFGGAFTPTAYPGTGKAYIADPARIGPVTGSPLGAAANRFMIERNGVIVFDEVNFTLTGRVRVGQLPGKVTVDRASYRANATSNKLDVFATAFPLTQGRLPAGVLPPSALPDMGFYPAPCATDAAGNVIGPPVGTNLVYFQMLTSDGNKWWGQDAPASVPTQVCVQDKAAGTYFLADVTDEVDLTVADYNPALNGGTLTVRALSSDLVTKPTLNVVGIGEIPATSPDGTLQISPIVPPPPKVTVVSNRGGIATLDVLTGLGLPKVLGIPIANADTVTIAEDGVAANINVLANDTIDGAPIDPAAATLAISADPALGTATLNLDNTITYTPKPNLNGTHIVGYTVTVGGKTSLEGYLTVNITPVNDPPVANGESTGAANNRAVTINVLANDTDVDGSADLASAMIITVPAPGATLSCGGAPAVVGTSCVGGNITLTPTTVGTFTFTYNAVDLAGAESASATVTVTVNSAETIGITKSQYIISKNRWRVDGTDSISSTQILTIAYDNGIFADGTSAAGSAIGAVVVSGGVWALDWAGTGRLNPTDATAWSVKPTRIRVTSPLGGFATANIVLKQ